MQLQNKFKSVTNIENKTLIFIFLFFKIPPSLKNLAQQFPETGANPIIKSLILFYYIKVLKSSFLNECLVCTCLTTNYKFITSLLLSNEQ